MMELLSFNANNLDYGTSMQAFGANSKEKKRMQEQLRLQFYSQPKTKNNKIKKTTATINKSVKDLLLEIGGLLTISAIGLGGLNLALFGLQKLVNEKLLIGKINEHFTKKLDNPGKMIELGFEMLERHGLQDKVKVLQHATDANAAFFTSQKNAVVLGENTYSAIFHEVGHAVVENKTKFLKLLQKSRNNYNIIAIASYLGLNALAKNYKENKYRNALTGQNETIVDKTKRFILKNKWVVPFVAFAPELITEGAATYYGLKFLKTKLNQGVISKNTYKNIRGSYLTCFGTYFFLPASILIIDKTANLIMKTVARSRQEAVQNKFRRRMDAKLA